MKPLLKQSPVLIVFELLAKKGFFRFLSDKQFIVLEYWLRRQKLPKFKSCQTFTEKVQLIKLHEGLERYSKYVDKYEVRNFISQMIGDKHLVPLYGVWDNFDEIEFDKLPQQFVIKAAHGSSYNFVCQDKSSLKLGKLRKIVTHWTSENFYQGTREIQYRDCQPRIICEKYLEDDSGGLIDYRFHCRKGKAYLIEVVLDRFLGAKLNIVFMDLNWQKLPISIRGCTNSAAKLKKPVRLREMIVLAQKLSKPFAYVRVDLYLVKRAIFFGELTFTPGNGMDIFEPPKADCQLGKLINLLKYADQMATK